MSNDCPHVHVHGGCEVMIATNYKYKEVIDFEVAQSIIRTADL